MTNFINVATASTSELLAFYNDHADRKITKFSDRKTAEKRVAALILSLGDKPAAEPKPEDKAIEPAKPKAEKKAKAEKKPEPKAKAKKAKQHATFDGDTREKMSAAQRESWKDPAVRESRCERSAVNVAGEDYRSVKAAFEALELPMSEHIRFRGQLKEAGKLKEYGYTWTIIPLNY